jgi:hypothetical protein
MALMRACAIVCLVLLGSLWMSHRTVAQEEAPAVSQSPPVMPKVKSLGKDIYLICLRRRYPRPWVPSNTG